ncbi:9941_t:CDS:2, partial [Ambispora gerdemannii]
MDQLAFAHQYSREYPNADVDQVRLAYEKYLKEQQERQETLWVNRGATKENNSNA